MRKYFEELRLNRPAFIYISRHTRIHILCVHHSKQVNKIFISKVTTRRLKYHSVPGPPRTLRSREAGEEFKTKCGNRGLRPSNVLGQFRGPVSVEAAAIVLDARWHPHEAPIHPRAKNGVQDVPAPERDLVRLGHPHIVLFFVAGVEQEGGHLDGALRVTRCQTRRPSCPSSGAERSCNVK